MKHGFVEERFQGFNRLGGLFLQKEKAQMPLFWILQIVGWTGYGIYRHIVDAGFFPNGIIYLLVGIFLTSAFAHPIYKWVWKRSPSFFYIALTAVVCSILGGFLYLLISKFIFVLLGIGSYSDKAWYLHVADSFVRSFVYNKTFVFLSWSALYFGIKYWRDVIAQREKTEEARRLANESQLEMLRYQLNPHFLFNSLNSIHALVRENPGRAEKMLDELSEFLRYSLLQDNVFETTLREEISIARSYLEIEKIRFEEMLETHIKVEKGLENFRVPSFIVHPLLENAVKYGMQNGEIPLKIKLFTYRKNNSVFIEVANTGKLTEKKSDDSFFSGKGTGIGIANVRRRLETAFSKSSSLEIFERGGWVVAQIKIVEG